MRFRIIFDNGLVCSRFMKSWFILDQESCATSEVLSQISSFFSIRDSFHAELDGFVIPDSQLFDKIVKEGEIVNIKKGPFTLFPRQDEFLKKPFNKHIKKLVKKEQEDSSESEPLKKPVKRIKKPFIEESSDSSSSESIVKPVRKKPEPKIPIKSLLVKQPEPEFRAKNLLVKQPEFRAQKDTGFDLQEFKTCAYDEIFPGDEILFKTLELRDDNTPGMSDFKNAKVVEKAEDGVLVNFLGDSRQELLRVNPVEFIEEGEFDNYQITIQKGDLNDLMKKK